MNNIIQKIKRLAYTRFFALFSLSAVAFTFQACYGMPQDDWQSVTIQGYVSDSETREPISGIRVAVDQNGTTAFTDVEGFFMVRAEPNTNYDIIFSDVDGDENGVYWEKTASLTDSISNAELSLKVMLNPKAN
ncbi:MAG: radical SAM-associated putative lipoprotein [Bacteroidales bacterium]|nr:radical SAM-associated putative lipoprotein [Bacteroidales bacterium]